MGVETGLCGTCTMARRIATAKGSTFFHCERADSESAYVKYPRLPVLACPGYLQGGGDSGGLRLAQEGDRPEPSETWALGTPEGEA